jgi:hypothetical protein
VKQGVPCERGKSLATGRVYPRKGDQSFFEVGLRQTPRGISFCDDRMNYDMEEKKGELSQLEKKVEIIVKKGGYRGFYLFFPNFAKSHFYPFFNTPSTQKYVKPLFLIRKFNYLKNPEFPKNHEKTVF